MENDFKTTDTEGRIQLGQRYANKQWKVEELDNGAILLIPVCIAKSAEVMKTFEKVFMKHKKTMNALK